MTTITPATPLPWHVGIKQAEQIIYDGKGWAVANATVYHGKADGAETRANAAYIVAACNAYPQLVAALREVCAVPMADFADCPLFKARALLRSLNERNMP